MQGISLRPVRQDKEYEAVDGLLHLGGGETWEQWKTAFASD